MAGRITATGRIAERLAVMADEPAFPGHVGPVSPQWQRLPVADRTAILSDNCDNRVSRADIAAGAHAATRPAAPRSRAGAWAARRWARSR